MYVRTAVVLAMCAAVACAAEVNIGSAVVTSGQPATLNVTLASGGAVLTGIQFDFKYDPAVFDVTVATGPAASDAGKTVQSAAVQAGQQRVLVVGFNQNGIADGVVAVLQVSLKAAPEIRKRYIIGIHELVGTNGQGESVDLSGHSGAVIVEATIAAQ